ncbi:MAG: ABC alpha-glucoside transporter, inner membrane subunit AglF, partial [uncultured Frankineae bacterium]
ERDPTQAADADVRHHRLLRRRRDPAAGRRPGPQARSREGAARRLPRPRAPPAGGRSADPGDPHRDPVVQGPVLRHLGRPGQLRLDVHQRRQPAHPAQHRRVGRPGPDAGHHGRPAVRHRDRQGARRGLRQGAGLHADGDLAGRRQHHLEVRLHGPAGRRQPDRPGQPAAGPRGPRALPLPAGPALEHAVPHRDPHLDPGRLRDGDPVGGHQGRLGGRHRGRAARRGQRLADVPQRDAAQHPARGRRRHGHHHDHDAQGLRHRAHDHRGSVRDRRRGHRAVRPGLRLRRGRQGLCARGPALRPRPAHRRLPGRRPALPEGDPM